MSSVPTIESMQKDQRIYWRYKGEISPWSTGSYICSPAEGLVTIKGLSRWSYVTVSYDEIEWKPASKVNG